MAKGILEIMSHLWLGLRPDQLSALLQRPSWRGLQKAPKPERWRVLDTADQRHRETPLIVSPTGKGDTGALKPQFDLTRTRWTDGALTLEHLVWTLANGTEHQAAWLRMPVGPSRDALRARLQAMHADARLADPIPVAGVDPIELGYRFLGAETGPRPAKLRLTPDMTGGAVLAAILDNVADGLLLHLPNVVWLRDPIAIHQARVALRRLRAALPLFGVRVDTPERAEAMRQTAGDIARRLGTVRDLDVFCSETLSRAEAEFPTEAGWANLKTVAEARRVAEAQVLTETVTAWDTTNFLLDLLHWRDEAGAQLPSGSGAGEVARTLLADRWRRVNRQGSRMDRIDVPGLHELRVKIKKLRYLVDFTKSLFDPNATSTWESRLSPLQDALGTLNDGASARSLIRGMMPILDKEGAFAAGLLIAWADGRTLRHRNRIQQLWDDLADLPPYWKD
jgi:triphosphatase